MGWVKYATVGAKAGTDLKESDGTVLTDAAVKNSAVSISAAGALSGGGGGTVAIGSLSGSSAYANSGISISAAGALSGGGGGTVAIASLSGSTSYQNSQISLTATGGTVTLNNAHATSKTFNKTSVGLGSVTDDAQVKSDGSNAPNIIKNDQISLTATGGTVTLNNAHASSNTFNKTSVGLGSVTDGADVTASNTAYNTARVGDKTVAQAQARLGFLSDLGALSGSLAAAQFPLAGVITAANSTAGKLAARTALAANFDETGGPTVHADNYTNTTYTSSSFNIVDLTGFSADTYANANIGKSLKTSLLHANWNGINGTAYTPDIASNASDTQDVTITMEGNGIEVTGTWRWTAYNSASGADKITDGAWVGSTPTGFNNPTFTGGTTLTKTVTFIVDSQYTNPVPLAINSAILNLSIGGGGKSDVRLKENINQIGTYKGYNIYTWTWNKLAKLLGVADPTIGVLAQEVQQTNPEAVIMENDGYLAVNYKSIFGDQNGN